MFLLAPAYPGCPGSKAVKRSLLLLLIPRKFDFGWASAPDPAGGAYSVPPDPSHTHTHPFNSPFSGTTRESRYQKCKTNLDFTEAGFKGAYL